MSLSLFAVKNQWYRNGKSNIIQEYGGSRKLPTELLANRPMTQLELIEGFSPINFTTFVSRCFTKCTLKAPTSPI